MRLPYMLPWRQRDAAGRAVIGPFTKTHQREHQREAPTSPVGLLVNTVADKTRPTEVGRSRRETQTGRHGDREMEGRNARQALEKLSQRCIRSLELRDNTSDVCVMAKYAACK